MSDLQVADIHPRQLEQKIKIAQGKAHQLAYCDIFELLNSLQAHVEPKPPQSDEPKTALKRFNRRRLKALPPLLQLPDMQPNAHDEEIWQQIKKKAKLLDVLKSISVYETLKTNPVVLVGISQHFKGEIEKLKSLATSFLTIQSSSMPERGYRLIRRVLPDLDAQDKIVFLDKWRKFDDELTTADDYNLFESYLQLFEKINLELVEVDDFNKELFALHENSQLYTWSIESKNVDRLCEITQTEWCFKRDLEHIAAALELLLSSMNFSECEKN